MYAWHKLGTHKEYHLIHFHYYKFMTLTLQLLTLKEGTSAKDTLLTANKEAQPCQHNYYAQGRGSYFVKSGIIEVRTSLGIMMYVPFT